MREFAIIRVPAKIKNFPLGEEIGDRRHETVDRRRKKTRDNYPIHKA
jgi:hypothetical protein